MVSLKYRTRFVCLETFLHHRDKSVLFQAIQRSPFFGIRYRKLWLGNLMPLVALGFLDCFLIPEVLLLSSHLKLSNLLLFLLTGFRREMRSPITQAGDSDTGLDLVYGSSRYTLLFPPGSAVSPLRAFSRKARAGLTASCLFSLQWSPEVPKFVFAFQYLGVGPAFCTCW